MFTIIFNIILTNIILLSYGIIFKIFLVKEKVLKKNLNELPLFGIILLSFISLLLNFIFPINKILGTIIFITGLLFFFNEIRKNNLIGFKMIKLILISSIITFFLIAFSNIYRPDAGLYHLPFLSILNENKILIGSANIHFRFATTSILQYLSAIQNNFIYDLKSVSIPSASIFSFFIIYLLREIKINFILDKKINSLIFFLITCYSLISFGRFSNYGNDAISHIYFLFLLVFILKNYSNIKFSIKIFNKLSLISIFLFATKAFMSLVLIIPFVFLILHSKKKEFLKNTFFYLNALFFAGWLIKSLLISGCLIYPIKQTCIESMTIYDKEKTTIEARSGEAWSKDWVNQKNVKLNFEDYNKNFNWIKTWKENHLKKIIEKIAPYLFFLILFFITIFFQKKKTLDKMVIKEKLPNKIHIIFFFTLMMVIIWFFKFPLYRYGAAFIAILITMCFIYLISFLNLIPQKDIMKKNMQIFLFICVLVIFTKNILRIHKNIYINSNDIWPNIYLAKKGIITSSFEKIENSQGSFLYFYSKGELCMYSQAPCSNYKIKNLDKKKLFIYDLYWIKKQI